MELKKINDLAEAWDSITQEVIEFRTPDFKELHRVFSETNELVEEYCRAGSVPKGVCEVLIEMHKFSWWVADLDDTPIHYLYREFIEIVYGLERYFFTWDANVETIKGKINSLAFGV